ncbi:hypothetical protein [Marispirochaeta sp.]|uniref:hypothetical protein n=1 Tax=Marispirochaeta sp. TaxID=2038653 RepID=UPI0029C95FB7|nr:hypothetical protein [Marispirochaeta sp.]
MAFQHSPVIEKMTRDHNVYFTLHWSPLETADKYRINSSVPSMSGVYELYYKDLYGKMILHEVNYAWYGGLRSRLRRITDPELEEDLEKRKFIERKKLFFRYCLNENYKDMQDVVFFLSTTAGLPPEKRSKDSGRYKKVYVRESSPNKITTL